MYGADHQQGYRTGGGRGGGSNNNNNTNANGTASKSGTAIPQRRSGATASGKQSLPAAAGSNNGSSNNIAGNAAAAPSSSSSPTMATSAPAMPLAAPRSQQLLASPRSPADYQSSPTATSPQGSPGVRGYYGSAFGSPNSPNGNSNGSYGKGPNNSDAPPRSGLERMVMEEGLVHTAPLSELNVLPGTNTVRVGYDGTCILRNITEAVQEQDPLAVFTVTIPLVLYNQQVELVKEVISVAEAVSASPSQPATASPRTFTPVFVFDGIPLSPLMDSPNAPFLSPPTEITPFHGHSSAHSAKTLPFNMRKLVAERYRIDDDVEAFFIRTLRVSFPEVFRAPYNAWAQLSAFFSPTNRYISEVYGCLELLAFPGIERVIVKFNPDAKTFDYVSKADVLSAVNRRLVSPLLTERDLSYIVLTDTQQKPYRIHSLPDTPNAFDDIIAKFGASDPLPDGRGRGYNFTNVYHRDKKQQLNANYSLLDAPVFTHDAAVLPLYTVYGTAPHSSLRARETFGVPLPPVLYFGLFSGLVMPNQLAAIGHGMLSDKWPLIDTAEYRKLLDFLMPVRLRTCLHLLSITDYIPLPSKWNRAYMSPKPLAKDKIIDVRIPVEVGLYDWDLAENEELNSREGQYFLNVLQFHTHPVLPALDGSLPVYYHTVQETTASVLLKTLDQLGYFTHSVEEDSNKVPIGLTTDVTACAVALQYFNCDTLSEYGLLCLELLRTQSLHDDPIHLTPNTSRQYVKDRRPGVRFASRLLSIIPIYIKDTWGGPFDPEIAAFGGIARALSKTIRLLMESITISTFATHRTDLPPTKMQEVLDGLPFGLPTEFGAGHLINYILYNEECTLEELQNVFPECSALYEDLSTLFWFWSMAIPAIRTLAEEIPTIDVDVVLAANEAIIKAALRLDAEAFGYVEECRREVESMIQFRVAYSEDMASGTYAPLNMQ